MRDSDQGFFARYLPNIIGWVLAGFSTFTLVTVKVTSLEQTRVDHERRLALAEQELAQLRGVIGDIRVDVATSKVILEALAKERGIQP
jgi:hypothetical protein